jgi:hypothetical protein
MFLQHAQPWMLSFCSSPAHACRTAPASRTIGSRAVSLCQSRAHCPVATPAAAQCAVSQAVPARQLAHTLQTLVLVLRSRRRVRGSLQVSLATTTHGTETALEYDGRDGFVSVRLVSELLGMVTRVQVCLEHLKVGKG